MSAAPVIAGALDLFERKDDWLAARGRLITSSRGPSVVGVGFDSAFRINLELRGRAEPRKLDGDGIEIGHEIEPALLRMLERRLPGLKVWKPAPYLLVRSAERPWLAASPDALAEHPDMDGIGTVELKTTDLVRRADWIKEDGSTTIPPYPLVQSNHHALAASAKWGIVACQIGLGMSARFVWRVLKADDRWTQTKYLPRLEAFHAAIERDEDWPADGRAATGEAMRDLYPKEAIGKVVTLPESAIALVDAYEEAKAQEREWKDASNEAKAQLQALMGDAGVGLLDGERYVQWAVEPRGGYEVEPSRPRVFRVKRRR